MEILQRFFFWCMVVNSGIYAFTAIAVLVFRDRVCRIHKRLFGLNEEAVHRSIQDYLATYKLFITFFNFAPWIAILIIK
ncbi:DUF6868 family protein [Nitrospirota bacterium]